MVRKLTIKAWVSTGLLLIVCLVIGIVPLWFYAPSALAALRGEMPLVDEPLSNIYGMSAIGLFLLVISLAVFIKMLADPVSKKVDRFLAAHPDVTMAHLDQEFSSAQNFGNIWVGGHWTFSHDLRSVVVDNTEIVRAYSEREHSRRQTNYYICLELKDGKTERAKVSYHNLTQLLEQYKRYAEMRVEDNL